MVATILLLIVIYIIIMFGSYFVFQASERYIFSVTYNNLFIIDAKPEDSGIYMCSAKNLLGQVTQHCEIMVKDSTTEVSRTYLPALQLVCKHDSRLVQTVKLYQKY